MILENEKQGIVSLLLEEGGLPQPENENVSSIEGLREEYHFGETCPVQSCI
jgi:hypothetical protein